MQGHVNLVVHSNCQVNKTYFDLCLGKVAFLQIKMPLQQQCRNSLPPQSPRLAHP